MVEAKIVVLGTGGTIAGTSERAGDNIGYIAAQVSVDGLLASLNKPWSGPVQAEQVCQIDSKDMDPAQWQALAGRCDHWLSQDDVRGIVITHGTDTLEETAYFLHAVLQAAKPVVLTCAMRPSTALGADGPQNLADAFAVAASPGARGVVAVCAGAVHGAPDVQKVHTYRLDAFSSGDAGPLAYVEEGSLRLLRPWPEYEGRFALDAVVHAGQWPWVEIVMSHAGAGPALVNGLVRQGVQGLVVAGTGNGTVHIALEQALLDAQSAGVQVRRSTRCPGGHVLTGDNASPLQASALSPVKARIDLQLSLLASSS